MEGNVLFNDAPQHILFAVIWRQTYGKGPFRKREETRYHQYMVYSYRLATNDRLYAPSHRQDSTNHGLCYTSRGTLAGIRNCYMMGRSDNPSHRRFITKLQKVVLCHAVVLDYTLVPASAPRLVYQKPWYVLSGLWDAAYKRTLAANRKEQPMWRQWVSFLAI